MTNYIFLNLRDITQIFMQFLGKKIPVLDE